MTKTARIRVEIRSREESIRLADGVVGAMMEADRITPSSKGPLGAGAKKPIDVPECRRSGGEVMASSAWLGTG